MPPAFLMHSTMYVSILAAPDDAKNLYQSQCRRRQIFPTHFPSSLSSHRPHSSSFQIVRLHPHTCAATKSLRLWPIDQSLARSTRNNPLVLRIFFDSLNDSLEL